ncbi:MAG: SDR family oxidoreductase [Phycisphaerae bacterium]|jgi:NAD(P)-dependent dehydrogenase (short-subunit alcohol dehydrogenase family)/rhamnose utilization protein RhaD (predicted bifunctional aldolase and dehydrogenase)
MAKTASKIDKALAELIKISNVVGRDTLLVQGGGGNTSVKTADGRYMYIKASGTALKDMNEQDGWRRMNINSVLGVVKDPLLAKLDVNTREVEVVNRLGLCCDDDIKSGARPSVEAHLHAMLDDCVIHLHPVVVGAYVNAKNGKAIVGKMFACEKYPLLWVPYIDPGFMLGREMFKLVSDYQSRYGRKPQIMLLEKHGLFVASHSPDSAIKLVHKAIGILSKNLKQPKASKKITVSQDTITSAKLAVRKAVFDATGKYESVHFFMNDTIAGFMACKDAGKLLSVGVLSPDELVYANGTPLWFEKCDAGKIATRLKTQIGRGQKPAAAFLLKRVGLFVSADEKTAPIVNDIIAASLFIRTNAAMLGGVNVLTKRQADFIKNWEAEAFRRQLVCGGSNGELKNRVALVTGGGSGLGRSIAIGLARAGTMVAIADIDMTAANKTLAMIKNELPKIFAMAVNCNVTSEEDVCIGFESLIERWGGLDIVVNAAGIAPAYPLVNLPVDKWRLALEINLTGYMLVAQAAARIMIRQGMGGSIINISSKSGLDASRDNTSYNATKAGELHIARGWAVELGQFGIRVNCVAPGNVFEGSKIWNPEYIKVCAKKYGITPEEVIPYYVNKTALKREIKGQDIADAVVFLCSEKARTITGQTLVADSGQVMVR